MATPAARPLTRTDVMSTSEVAELLRIPRSTVYELARRGDLPARRVGRRWLFLRDPLAGRARALRRSGGDSESESDEVARFSDAPKRGCKGRGPGPVLRPPLPR